MPDMQFGHLVFSQINGLESLTIETRHQLPGFDTSADGHADKQVRLPGIGNSVVEFSHAPRTEKLAKTAKAATRFRHRRGQQATRNLTIGTDLVQFSARFNGVSREIAVPIYAVQSIFARENGRGVFFDPETPPGQAAVLAPATPALQSVPTIAVAKITDATPVAKADDDQGPPDKPKAPPRGKLRIIK